MKRRQTGRYICFPLDLFLSICSEFRSKLIRRYGENEINVRVLPVLGRVLRMSARVCVLVWVWVSGASRQKDELNSHV